MKKAYLFLATFLGIFLITKHLQAQEDWPRVFDVENTGSECETPTMQTSTNYNLPNPFEWSDGSGIISTYEEWSCRRNEIISELEYYEIGPKPKPPDNVSATYSNGTLTVTITDNGRSLTLTSDVNMPSGTGPFPVVIGMNNPTGSLSSSLFTGCIQIAFKHDQVVNYNMNSNQSQTDPYYQIYPDLWGQIGNYSAWSWGVSRIIDALEILETQMNVDLEHISVTGCSYAGKMALFSGALDERIALTIVQESGGGGINSWRLSQDFTDRTGTNVEKIDNTNYSWFKTSMRNLNPYSLPHDHHELIGLIAPRAVLIFGNPYQEWLGDESGYKTSMAAFEIWKAMNIEDRFGFDFASGHDHCSASTSQNSAAEAYITKFLKNGTANTNIQSPPNNPAFDLNYESALNDWVIPDDITPPNTNGPRVTIVSPINGAEFTMSDTEISIEATVVDSDNNLSQVEFFINDVLIDEKTSAPFTTTWRDVTGGTSTLRVRATDAENNTGSASRTIQVQGPYNGSAHAIPGTIEFEAFDVGGNGVAYFDEDAGTNVSPDPNFRSDEDVDIENCDDDGGYNIGYTMAGEWLEYTVTVAQTGLYNIDFRIANETDTKTISLAFDGTTVAGNISIPATGGWQTWETVSVEDIQLTAGTHIMRLTIGDSDYVNLNNATFTAVSVVDNCPDDPNKTELGICGCGTPDIDTDGDGTMDCLDNCPNDPNKTEPGMCGCGQEEGSCEQEIDLTAGWNLVGCPLSDETNVDEAMGSIWQYVEQVKDFDTFYSVDQNPNLNTLQTVSWSKAYLVKVSQDCTLIWQ
jgi:hypothetical protein